MLDLSSHSTTMGRTDHVTGEVSFKKFQFNFFFFRIFSFPSSNCSIILQYYIRFDFYTLQDSVAIYDNTSSIHRVSS